MITTTKCYRITKEGVFYDELHSQQVELTEAFAKSLAEGVLFEARNVARGENDSGIGRIHLRLGPTDIQYWTAEIGELTIIAPVVADGEVVTPNFAGQSGHHHEPEMKLKWSVPEDMRVRFMAQVEPSCTSRYFTFLAFDGSNMPYRLPLPNLYDDGSMCLGSGFTARGETGLATFQAALRQLTDSSWNTDLMRDITSCKGLFRFKPTKKGFDQVDPLFHWTKLSVPISPGTMKMISL